MKDKRNFFLIEGYVGGTLSDAERAELLAAVQADEETKKLFVYQVRLARRMRAILRGREGAITWSRVAALITPNENERRARIADAVDAQIDEHRRRVSSAQGRASVRSSRRWIGLALPAAAVIALVAVVTLRGRKASVDPDETRFDRVASTEERAANRAQSGPAAPPRSAQSTRDPAVATGSPAAVATDEGAHVPVVVSAAGEPLSRQASQELIASEGLAFAKRQDVVLYTGFESAASDGAFARWWVGSKLTDFAPGLSGNGLRVRYEGGNGPHEPSARFVISANSKTAPATNPGTPPAAAPVAATASALREAKAEPVNDEVYLRYYVRLGAGFDYGMGGVLPGICGGACGAPPSQQNGRDGWAIRLSWLPSGELSFEHMGGRREANLRRWHKTLSPGTWHAIEIRVKLNAPDESDGVIEGWLDGERATSITGVRIRRVPTLHVDGVTFDTFFRGRGRGPSRDVEATFDNLALAKNYVGLREGSR